jgi:UDP-N-acetylglucosamine acyltransferase
MARSFKSKAQASDYTTVKSQKHFPTLGDPLRRRHNTPPEERVPAASRLELRMPNQIHPTAIVDRTAQLGQDVLIGPHAIIEADTIVGDGCHIMAGAIIGRYTTLGRNNIVHPYAVLGSTPQDLKFRPDDVTYLKIGDQNVIYEYVTISRGTTATGMTVIGSHCMFMTEAHIGHDSRVGDHVILVNGTAMAGHTEIQDRAVLSAHTCVHQFCWVGELVMSRGNSAASQHVPPFVLMYDVNRLAGLNVVGMRRAGYSPQQRLEIKEAYRLLYRCGLTPAKALAEMEQHAEWGPGASKFRAFVRRVLAAEKPCNRGLISYRRDPDEAEEEDEI